MSGRLLQDITIFPAIEPFIKVTAENKNRERLGENSEVQERLEGPNAMSTVLVVHRISSFLASGENHIVFSVIG